MNGWSNNVKRETQKTKETLRGGRRKGRRRPTNDKTNDFKIKKAKKDVVVHPLFKMKHTEEEEEEEEEEDKERRLLGTREDDDDDHLE